jgi:hemoglobin
VSEPRDPRPEAGEASRREHGRVPALGLVERIGGRERLRALLVVFYERLFADPMIGFFFRGHGLESIVDGQFGFLLWAFGAEPVRTGRHPSEAHRDLPPILRGHFDRRLVVLREVLEEHDLEPAVVDAWLRVEESMRPRVQARR